MPFSSDVWGGPASAEPDCRAGGRHRLASALVLPEIGVLGSGDVFPQTYSQVGLFLSAVRLSWSREEGLWHAS